MSKKGVKMEANGQWLTTQQVMPLIGLTDRSSVSRFLRRNGISPKKYMGPRGRAAFLWNKEKIAKKFPQPERQPERGEPEKAVPVAVQVPVAVPIAPLALEHTANTSDEMLTVKEARILFGHSSDSGTRDYLKRLGVPKQQTVGPRGMPMFLYAKRDLENVLKTGPKPRITAPRRRSQLGADDFARQKALVERGKTAVVERLNQSLLGHEKPASTESVVEALKSLFAENPRLVEVAVNRTTGEVRVVMAVETKL